MRNDAPVLDTPDTEVLVNTTARNKPVPPKSKRGFINFLALPVCKAVGCVHKLIPVTDPDKLARMGKCHRALHHLLHSKRGHTTVAGLVIAYSGSFMALHPIGLLDHALWDMAAYAIHGLGAAPVLKVLADRTGWEI